jgi:5-methylcytosine-specific restriction endonuclease McrBC regulatory subunit McrC
VQILKHSEIKYGQGVDEIYGVLIDAAWLWEEYIAILIQDKYYHYYKDRGPRFNLFENFQQIIPDYISISDKVIADAKYIPLNRESRYFEEKATSIYYKTITYMYRFCSHKAYLFYPISEAETCKLNLLKIKTDSEGVNGGTIIKHGLRIPQDASSFADFVVKMELNERVFLDSL